MSDGVRSHSSGPLLLMVLLAAGPVQAQIVTDGSVGAKVSLQGGEIKIGAELGTRRDNNLFHSFEKFGIASGQTATFTGPGDIKNVISRVTGGEVSKIDGTLASRVGQADLYFLNPAGVMFGPNAQLDVPGSFHVSTAHELRFADGARFSALDKTGSGLTVAPPEAFGFLDKSPGRIAVDQSQLRVEPSKTLSLAGGDIDIGGLYGAMAVEGGTITLTSITGAGQSRISDGAVDAARQGAIRLSDYAQVVTSGNGGGTIRIHSGNLSLEQSTVAGRGGNVSLSVGQLLYLRNSAVTTSDGWGAGSSGNIFISSPLIVVNSSRISANGFSWPNGNITIWTSQLIRTPDSLIEDPNAPRPVNVSNPELPSDFLNASALLPTPCATRGDRPASSFAAGGRGGLPPDPGAPLAASSFGQSLEQQTATGAPTALTPRPPQAAKPITVSGIPQPVLGSPRLTCRG